MEAESSPWSYSSRTRRVVVLLLADQSRAGEGLGFCISDRIQAADAATPTPRQVLRAKTEEPGLSLSWGTLYR